MKKMLYLAFILALTVLLTACGQEKGAESDVSTSDATVRAEESLNTEGSANVTSSVTAEALTEPPIIDVFFYPREDIRDMNILTVRWGESIPESRYEYYWGDGKDENGNTVPLLTGMTAVKVEVLKVWNQAEYVTGNGHAPTFSFSEITYLWVDDETLSGIQKADTAIVFPYAHDPNIRQDYDFTPFYPYLFMDGSQDYSVILHDTVGKPVNGNVFPIVDGKIQIAKSDSVSWSMQVNSFLRYNELLDREKSSTPRFADGMTVEEFAELMDSVK